MNIQVYMNTLKVKHAIKIMSWKLLKFLILTKHRSIKIVPQRMVKSVFTVQWLTTANWIFRGERDYGKVIIIKHNSHIKQAGKKNIFNFIFVFILVSEFIYIQQEYGVKFFFVSFCCCQLELFIKCFALSARNILIKWISWH